MKQSVTDCAIKQRGAGVRNMMMMEDSAKLTKGILAVNYMRVAALMVYASIAQLAERRTVNAYVEGSSPSRGASRHKEDAELKLSTIKQISNRYDASYFLYMHL